MASAFQWITYSTARQALAVRLCDSGIFWTDAENGLYLIEALRTWNALTEAWNADYSFTAKASSGTWWNLATASQSPRLHSVTLSDLYTLMQYHLLEPPTGDGLWRGSSQFSLPMLQAAVQRRMDEVTQLAGCNLTELMPIPVVPENRRMALLDSVFEPRRVRFVPVPGQGSPITLTREDSSSWDHFSPDHLQSPALPSAWGVLTGPPLTIDLDVGPNVPGTLDVIALTSESVGTNLLNVPDDWAWVVKWGAMADLLSQESEATDLQRAEFSRQRYLDGLKAMTEGNWLLLAQVNGVPCDTPSLREMDRYSPEWETQESAPYIVQAGIDFVAPCPVPTGSAQLGVVLTVVGNAPIPQKDDDFVQVSRDSFDAILSYAQALAIFKMGGAEFKEAGPLVSEFALAVQRENARMQKMGLFADVLRSQGKRQERGE